MKNLKIRYAKENDAEIITLINVSSWKKTYKNIFPDEFLDNLCKTKEKLDETINKIKKNILEKNNYIVAEYDGKVVGFAKFGVSKKEKFSDCGEIYALYVDNDLVKKGIGTSIIKYVNNLLFEQYDSIVVSCIKENSSNEFYKKIGFIKKDECKFNLGNEEYIENIYILNNEN